MDTFSDTRVHSPRNVVVLVTENSVILDAAGPLQAFHEARSSTCRPLYRTIVASPTGGGVRTDCGVSLMTSSIYELPVSEIDTLLVAGADDSLSALRDARLMAWLREARSHIRRIGSICIGAFLLAEAGLLDGGQAVTHWRWCSRFKSRFPHIPVQSDRIYLRHGNVWTSAGVTTGIDMSLAMIEQDCGKKVALDVARTLVVFMHRPGGQSQFSAVMAMERGDRGCRFDELHSWIIDNIAKKIDIGILARQMNMTPRTFARLYRCHAGDTPANVVRRFRIEQARMVLENTAVPISTVARRCGFGDTETMRRAFAKSLGVAPVDYRKRFSDAVA